MDAEEKLNQKVWNVLCKIKEKELLSSWRDLSLNYGYATDDEERILLWLQEQKSIELINTSRFTNLSSYEQPKEVKLKLIKPAFDEIYEEYKEKYAPQITPSEETKGTNKKVSAETIEKIIKSENIRGKQEKLLRKLSRNKSLSEKEIKKTTETRDCKNLKYQLKEKIKRHGLNIKVIRPKTWGGESLYQLEFLTK